MQDRGRKGDTGEHRRSRFNGGRISNKLQEQQEGETNRKRWDETEQQNFFLLRLELLSKQQTNKQEKKQPQQIDFYIHIIYTHIYLRKEALVAFTGQMRVKT